MARNGNLVMPPGWKYELVTDEANSYQTFVEQIKAADSGNTIGLLGNQPNHRGEGRKPRGRVCSPER